MTRLVKRVIAGIGTWRLAGRKVGGSHWVDAIVLDARFGIRMLVKHRGLTAIGAFAMAVAIAVGATTYAAVSAMLDPALPFPGGDRIVSLKFVGSNAGSAERRVIHEFVALRDQLVTVEHFGALRPQCCGTRDQSWRRAANHRRRHAGRVQVSLRSPVLGAIARRSAEVRALGRPASLHVWPARARCHDRPGTGRVCHDRTTDPRCASRERAHPSTGGATCPKGVSRS